MTSCILEVQNVWFRYQHNWVLEDVSLCVADRDFVGLIGPNGGGKSTLLKLILGLLVPNRGTVDLFGTTPVKSAHKVGYVPQSIQIDPQFPITVSEVVQLGCQHGLWKRTGSRAEIRQRVEAALHEVDLNDCLYKPFQTLSGGQQQRVLIARALVSSPELLLMDEPTANVDSLSQNQFYEMLHRLNRNCAIILVSHDVGVVTSHVTRVACINRTLVQHTATAITDSDLQSIYHASIRLVDHSHSFPATHGDSH